MRARDRWYERPFEPLPVLRALNEYGVEFVLIGGLAAVLQGSPLPTYDIDIALSPSASNLNRLQATLRQLDAVALGRARDLRRALADGRTVSFSTRFGKIDVNSQPAGFDSYASLRRGARRLTLESGFDVLCSPIRDIIRSRMATGDSRQMPALETALELAGALEAEQRAGR
jgi:hypothetical protein